MAFRNKFPFTLTGSKILTPYKATQSIPSRWGVHLGRFLSTDQSHEPIFRVAIIGSGPAGFYAASKLLYKSNEVIVDMYEQLPVPFGLVRFGVAPDHPEVKNCQDRFTEVAESPRFNFIGNVRLGYDLPLKLLKPHYDAILFAYGASKDRELGLPGEQATHHIYSARAFVGWYNGLPEYRDLNPDLTAGEDAIILGQGNVSLDVARLLLTDIDVLRKTDVTEYALETLASSRVKRVKIVGRRGPIQAAFTIKELRELMQLPVLNETSLSSVPEDVSSLPRATKRLVQLLQKGQIAEIPSNVTEPKTWSLEFLLSPHSLGWDPQDPGRLTHVEFQRNQLKDPLSPESGLIYPSDSEKPDIVSLKGNTLFRSIGYKSEPIRGLETLGVEFDTKRGIIPNDPSGRVLGKDSTGEEVRLPGLYAAGWVKRGPTGVIASTMTDAFVTAEAMLADWAEPGRPLHDVSSTKSGWKGVRSEAEKSGIHLAPVAWHDWLKIDRAEKQRGIASGKPREKFGSIQEMLAVI